MDVGLGFRISGLLADLQGVKLKEMGPALGKSLDNRGILINPIWAKVLTLILSNVKSDLTLGEAFKTGNGDANAMKALELVETFSLARRKAHTLKRKELYKLFALAKVSLSEGQVEGLEALMAAAPADMTLLAYVTSGALQQKVVETQQIAEGVIEEVLVQCSHCGFSFMALVKGDALLRCPHCDQLTVP